MKLSKIIDELTKLKDKHGDVNIDNIVGYLDDCNVTVDLPSDRQKILTQTIDDGLRIGRL